MQVLNLLSKAAFIAACMLPLISCVREPNGSANPGDSPASVTAKAKASAWDYFRRQCAENARESIYRVVSGVEGIYLKKPRQRATDKQLGDQYWMGDPYGYRSNPKADISSYVYALDSNGIPTTSSKGRKGYEFVETPGSNTWELVRYRRDGGNDSLAMEIVTTRRSEFSVHWEDISTLTDRSHWVARSKLVVQDLETGEILGERIAFLIEAGFGSTAGARKPWLHARLHADTGTACPPIRPNSAIDRLFVEKVLQPS